MDPADPRIHLDLLAAFRDVAPGPGAVAFGLDSRRRIQAALLNAYPANPRDVFIHVPKCAGTDLVLALGPRRVPVPKLLEVPGWVSEEAFLRTVAALSAAAASGARLFAYGHMVLGEYVAGAGVRPGDAIFTVLREPASRLVSQANYAVGRLRQDPAGRDPDTAELREHLGIRTAPPDLGPADLKALALRALLHPKIAQPDRACFYLGSGGPADWETALANLHAWDVEVATTETYDRWLAEKWGSPHSRRHNRSEPFLTPAEAMRLVPARLRAATQHDRRLYDIVARALRRTGAASVKGTDLFRLAADGPCPGSDPAAVPDLVAADEPETIAYRLAPPPAIPGVARAETVLDLGFGRGDGSDAFRMSGWAIEEAGCTWTDGREARIVLPGLRGPGVLVLRMLAGPFVHPPDVPRQTVRLFAGPHLLGAGALTQESLLEVELPADTTGAPVAITLQLPDAAVPFEVNGADDDRLLALSVKRIAVLRVVA